MHTMSSQITVSTDTLRKLHRIHQQLRDLKERLGRGPRVVQARQANVSRLEKDLEDLKAKSKALRVASDAKQLQLQTGETAVKRRRQQLLEAKTNAELPGAEGPDRRRRDGQQRPGRRGLGADGQARRSEEGGRRGRTRPGQAARGGRQEPPRVRGPGADHPDGSEAAGGGAEANRGQAARRFPAISTGAW